jgi:Fur family ferric uptake transcriptional regulator
MITQIEKLCIEKNIKLTENGKIIAKIISKSTDHPDVEEVYKRASKANNKIGIATVYRTVRMFEEAGVIAKHDFLNKGRARYEAHKDAEHHDHIIDITNDNVIEFFNEEIENLKNKIAKDHGFELIGHKLELYCRPLKKD